MGDNYIITRRPGMSYKPNRGGGRFHPRNQENHTLEDDFTLDPMRDKNKNK